MVERGSAGDTVPKYLALSCRAISDAGGAHELLKNPADIASTKCNSER